MSAIDRRQRASILFVMLIYIVGYITGRSGRQLGAAQAYIAGYARARST